MRLLTTTTAVLALTTAAASAQFRVDIGHWDLEVEYTPAAGSDPAGLEFLLAAEDGTDPALPAEIDPADAFLVPGNTRTLSADVGGISAGTVVTYVPQTRDFNTLWLGLSSEETGPGVFVNDTLEIELVGYAGPGDFVVSVVDPFGMETALVDTTDGLGDFLMASTTGDSHFNYNFTTPGTYETTFVARGSLIGGGTLESSPATYTWIIPEPTTLAIVPLAIAGLGRRRR